MSQSPIHAIKASILHCLDDPTKQDNGCIEYLHNGVLILRDGIVVSCSSADNTDLPDNALITDLSGKLLIPGFVDTHIHYPQTDIIAAYGTQLLEWLERYTFPEESFFYRS